MEKNSIMLEIDKDTLSKADEILNDLGLDMTTGVNMFLKAVIREQRIPFPIDLKTPDRVTKELINDVKMNLNDIKAYNVVEEFIEKYQEEVRQESENAEKKN